MNAQQRTGSALNRNGWQNTSPRLLLIAAVTAASHERHWFAVRRLAWSLHRSHDGM